MTKEAIITKTMQIINELPQDKAEEIFDFAEYLLNKYEDRILTEGIQKLTMEGGSFDFLLNDKEGFYTIEDLKRRSGE